MLHIDRSDLIGKGHHRECFRHPEDAKLCVKIIFAGDSGAREANREGRYYQRLEKRKISWEMIPRYHGDVATNLGPGLVFDLVSDPDGSPSKSISHYISTEAPTVEHFDELREAFARLRTYLLSQNILTSILHPRNLLCQRKSGGGLRLQVVDNIGNTEFIRVSDYVDFLAKRKVLRRWKRFEDRLLAGYPENGTLGRLISELRAEF